jgi:hypothetical protein
VSVSANRIRDLARALGQRRSVESFRAARRALQDSDRAVVLALRNSRSKAAAQDSLIYLAAAVEAIEAAVDRIALEVHGPPHRAPQPSAPAAGPSRAAP